MSLRLKINIIIEHLFHVLDFAMLGVKNKDLCPHGIYCEELKHEKWIYLTVQDVPQQEKNNNQIEIATTEV